MFRWTRHRVGEWSAHGYQIKGVSGHWRLIRDGQFWDKVTLLTDAKRQCERDFARRSKS